MPSGKPSSELSKRVAQLAEETSLSHIARKTGVNVANVSRYAGGRRVPADFCVSLVREMDVNPGWLLMGEGSPYLSDVAEDTEKMGTNLLELVEAMNAVTRMRLGALAGKRHLRVLRELNDALRNYEELRERMNKHSAPIFEQLIDELNKAISKLDIDRVADLREAARQVERLCDEPGLSRKFTGVQAMIELIDRRPKQGLKYQQQLVRERLTEGEIVDAQSCDEFIRLAILYEDIGRPATALRILNAADALIAEEDTVGDTYAMLQSIRGMGMISVGQYYEGLALLQRYQTRLEKNRRDATRTWPVRAHLFGGIMKLDDVYGYDLYPDWKAMILAEYAMLSDDEAQMRRAWEFFEANRTLFNKSRGRMDQGGFIPLLQLAIRAQEGDKKACDEYQSVRSEEPSGEEQVHVLVARAQLARLAGADQKARKLTQQADEGLRNLTTPLITIPARHYTNVRRLKMKGEISERAEHFLKSIIDAGYRIFDT